VNVGLNGVETGTTTQAIRLGAQRLTTVLAGRTPPAQPEGLLD
jgi:hypothetical protein